ncbi:MAG: hypothetical protein KatS3mg014_1826 [Actinomycetota bacterium]|nr:MAG: hypothetical protein KatS3mg014_1826 [Actinomycetota bacterium]
MKPGAVHLGRLTAATASGSEITYVLDPFGRIASRTQGGTTESFTYEGTGFTLARRIRGSTTTLHAATPAGPLAERTGTTVSFYLSDLHGDILGLVQAGGTTPSSRAYGTPWGELSWSGPAPVLGFQSQYTDPATGAVATPGPVVPALPFPLQLPRSPRGGPDGPALPEPLRLRRR